MRELKWEPGQSAELSVLGDGGNSRQQSRILELTGKQVLVAAKQPVKTGAAVRLEWNNQLLLGEVLNAEPDGFRMEIRHMLLDTDALSWQKQGWQRG